MSISAIGYRVYSVVAATANLFGNVQRVPGAALALYCFDMIEGSSRSDGSDLNVETTHSPITGPIISSFRNLLYHKAVIAYGTPD